jgi:pilus assembly protein CpaF
LVKFGAISPEGAQILQIIGRVRCNVLISGGTGSGKTTLLNCLTQFIEHDERVITCEDAAELQLQQPHVVRLETRPPNIEGEGQVTMRELVRNCLRMRPERIIVGEVRGPEAFDLLQAMNTGHDGSMGTLHANNPREALSRCESMITMGGFSLPSRTIREMICASIDVIVQAARLRDGSRRITHITEVMGHGRRHHHHPGRVPVRHDRRRRQRQDHRAAPLDRIGRPRILGARAIFRRREAACGRARRRRSHREYVRIP